jgi:hypothetical protein
VAVGLAAAFLAGCGSSGGGSDDATTTEPQFVTTTAAETTTTGGAASTSAAVTSTTVGGGTATTSTEPANGLKPGDACSLEEGSPDCIDPEGDGEGVYLIGGAACIADSGDPATCADLDGDGYAGYPDSQ